MIPIIDKSKDHVADPSGDAARQDAKARREQVVWLSRKLSSGPRYLHRKIVRPKLRTASHDASSMLILTFPMATGPRPSTGMTVVSIPYLVPVLVHVVRVGPSESILRGYRQSLRRKQHVLVIFRMRVVVVAHAHRRGASQFRSE
ncbi:hypothetical protein M404DRAFT_874116 [Pisolithus tinctorius Marx 270]|uniref:Uncharacterized protein n=1 Tax=Pisolithus tinctorius Marx 270 TaxID=870435 RepID=A0A0C3PAS0_PISTI|nr:hypothetical protein M404DRAFT_874116 [Pisolithus tinctorius Marx 270]